jgi:DNA-binding IclR family transcriptional regulator
MKPLERPHLKGTVETAADKHARPSGTQSVDRALGLLKLVARAPHEGFRLADLASACDLDRGTAHRLLSSLAANGLVEQDLSSRRYMLGLEFFSLAAAASNRYDLAEVARDALVILADKTGDSVFFSLRAGNDSICIDVQTGAFPIKTLPMDIGSRRPLGAGAVGVAFLAALPDPEVDRILAENQAKLTKFPGQDEASIRAAIAACRKAGYALNVRRSELNLSSIAIALLSRRGRPVSVLSLSAISQRLGPDRLTIIAKRIRAEGAKIVEKMLRIPDHDRHRLSWSHKRNEIS